MKLGPRAAWLVVLALIAGAAMLPWPVTVPVRWALRGHDVDSATWVPYRSLELRGLRLKSPLPGQLRVAKVTAAPEWGGILRGHLRVLCTLDEILWQPPGVEAVRLDGEGVLRFQWKDTELVRLSLSGPAARLRAEGRLRAGQDARLLLEGELERGLLEKAGWVHESEQESGVRAGWEPFRLRVEGPTSRPRVEFSSHFLTFSMNVPGEPTP